MLKTLCVISLCSFNMLCAMEGNAEQAGAPQKQITTAQELLKAHLPPLQKMRNCRAQAGNTTNWFCTEEEKLAYRKEIERTELYKTLLRNPQEHAQTLDELFTGINEYSVSALDMCCKAVPVRDLALTAFFDTDACCQSRSLSLGFTLMGTVFFCNAVAQYRRNKKEIVGIMKSWLKKKVLVEMLREVADKKNK